VSSNNKVAGSGTAAPLTLTLTVRTLLRLLLMSSRKTSTVYVPGGVPGASVTLKRLTDGENVLLGSVKSEIPRVWARLRTPGSKPLKLRNRSVAFRVTPVVFVILPVKVTVLPGVPTSVPGVIVKVSGSALAAAGESNIKVSKMTSVTARMRALLYLVITV